MILGKQKFKYSKVRENILDAILAGDLAPDAILPSELELRKKLGIGRNTLRTALHELEEAGIIIKQHGRQSRINVEALRKQREPLRRIAWVDTSPIRHTNPIYFEIFRSVSEQATLRNVKLDYVSLSIEAMAENFLRRQQEYDGLILGEFTRKYQRFISEITHKNAVCVDCPRPGIAHCVKTDCYLGGQIAARTLIESGHRKPVYLRYAQSIIDYLPFQERFLGFCDFMSGAGYPLPQERILEISCPEDEDHFDRFLKKRLGILRKADSFFAFYDDFAVAALYALQNFGMHIPDDLSLLGFDGLTLSRFVSPALTTIRQPVREIGIKAMEIVLNPAESDSYPEIIQIPPVLETGATVLTRNIKSTVPDNKSTLKGKKK